MPSQHSTSIRRAPLLASHELRGFYRYKNLFQLVPPDSADPRPDVQIGWYGLTLEYVLDPVAPRRESDTWAHDHRERQRIELLHNRAKTAQSEWFDTDEHVREQLRPLAIVRELVRLLSILTNYLFKEPPNEHLWVLDDPKTGTARWAQMWYPSFATGPTDSFTPMSNQRIALIDPSDYYSRLLGYGPGDPVIELPADVDYRLDTYFSLAPAKKIATARAAELLGTARDTWRTSRSVSLAAAVFAVEALIHADDPSPKRCKECNSLLSTDHCNSCGAPRYGLTRRFRDFVEKYSDTDNLPANRLYDARSDIAHQGRLLRADEFDSGFNLGGKDSQTELEYGVTSLVRSVFLVWLSDH